MTAEAVPSMASVASGEAPGDVTFPPSASYDISFPEEYSPAFCHENRDDYYKSLEAILTKHAWEIDEEKLREYADGIDIKEVIDVDISASTPSLAKDEATGKLVELGSKKVTVVDGVKATTVKSSVNSHEIDLSIEYVYDTNAVETFRYRSLPEWFSADHMKQYVESEKHQVEERLRLINIARIIAYNVMNFSFFPDNGNRPWFIDGENGETVGEDDESFAIVDCMKRYEKSIGSQGECWADTLFLETMSMENMEEMFRPSSRAADPAGSLPLLDLRLKALHSLGRMYASLQTEQSVITGMSGGDMLGNIPFNRLHPYSGVRVCNERHGDVNLISLQLFLHICIWKTESVRIEKLAAGGNAKVKNPLGAKRLKIGHKKEDGIALCKVENENVMKLLDSCAFGGKFHEDYARKSDDICQFLPVTRRFISCSVFVSVLASLCPAFRDVTGGVEIAKRPQLTISMLFADKLLNFIDTETMTAFADYRLPQLFLSNGFVKNTDRSASKDVENAAAIVSISDLVSKMQSNTFIERESPYEVCFRAGTLVCAWKLTQILKAKHGVRLRAADTDYYIWRKCIEEEGKGLLLPFPKCRTFCY